MAKLPKSPQEKKRLSLQKDRRNTYRENSKSSRKNIPKSKALSHRQVRRKGRAALDQAFLLDDAGAEVAISTLSQPVLPKPDWQKTPDKPLGEVLRRKGKR